VLYCAGSIRYSVPQADFLLHPVALATAGNITLDQPTLQEQIKQLQSQTESISSIITRTISQKQEAVQEIIEHRTRFNASEAKKWGLVQEFKQELIPEHAQIISIQIAENAPASNIGSPTGQTAFTLPDILSFHSSPPSQGFTSYPPVLAPSFSVSRRE
jgi:hypothetical protein